jgi:hypothetical protein
VLDVQVMYARQHERQAMKDALEMAVLTTVSHPNIIQVYNCFTDMVEDAGEAQVLQAAGADQELRGAQCGAVCLAGSCEAVWLTEHHLCATCRRSTLCYLSSALTCPACTTLDATEPAA